MLRDLGAPESLPEANAGEHPARLLAESGLMWLEGSGTPVLCPVPLPDCANGALNAFRALADIEVIPGVSGAVLLTERAAITRTPGGGDQSPHCRLLATLDGTIGLNLAREEDWELLPAWLETLGDIDWPELERLVQDKASDVLLERGRLLGLAVADAVNIPITAAGWVTVNSLAPAVAGRRTKPRILDLSSLWAGPLCSQLWQAAGAEVVKIEGSRRPDGARAGSREFFDLLNDGKHCLSLDLHQPAGHRALLEQIRQADIVLEASRPRALRHMGIIAEDLLRDTPGLTWVSITGYGRSEPRANWVAFGDDAGVSAGLSAILHQATGQWQIYGDAIADPLTGLHAALAGWSSWSKGGGDLVELSLEQTIHHCIAATAPPKNDYRSRHQEWKAYLVNHNISPSRPKRRCEALSSAQS